jgi:hypothetical protein
MPHARITPFLPNLALQKFAFPLYLFLATEGEFYAKEFLLLQNFTLTNLKFCNKIQILHKSSPKKADR